jgi:hypothetical protein
MKEKKQVYGKVACVSPQGYVSIPSYFGENDYGKTEISGITIHYHLKNSSLNPPNILRAVLHAQKRVKEYLGHNLNKIDNIHILNSMEEMQKHILNENKSLSWVGGIFHTGKIMVIAEPDDPDALYVHITHEIIHLAVYQMSNGKCSCWLDEGISVYLSQDLNDTYLKQLVRATDKNSFFPFEALEQQLPDTDENTRQLIYAQCFSMTKFLAETKGWEVVRLMFAQSATKPMSEILKYLGLNYYFLEKTWKQWLQKLNA